MRQGKKLAVTALTGLSLLTAAGVAGAAPTAEGAAERGGLERFHRQHLSWQPCGDEKLDAAGAECADVAVPLDYREPRGRTITVAISRLKASDGAKRRGVMLSNPGGPGGAGLDMMLTVRDAMTPEVRARYDLIGMDPRGIGRSTPVDCGWPVGSMLQSAGVDRASFERGARTQADLAQRCRDKAGDLLPHITTRNTARDMDVIRGALKERRISYFGVSYGTYLGAVYTQMFPQRSDRVVLDSATDPDRWTRPARQLLGKANETALDDWAAWAADRDAEYHLGGTAARVRALVEDLVRSAAREPIRLGEHRLDQHYLPLVLFGPLSDARQDALLTSYVRQIADAAGGKVVQPSPELDATLRFAYRPTPETQNSGQAAVMCGDAAEPRDPESYWRDIERHRATQPVFGAFAHNITPCAFWAPPVERPTEVRNSVPALIVQATGDTRTTYETGVALHRSMTKSRLVTLKDVRIHGVFEFFPNKCVRDSVNTYLADGTLPARDRTCHVD
ncbi:alpha/beta fold hydrolase [Saccharothrix australiensis]|uniref:Alpha/beta hydrolase family protein n=1 Tax=Saccharothrix australiensis TaxID=2072 RepID=A0A495VXD6_9PSEU|nr:alpha/beta fold hydrolase [Saccharothrix australiensis]RKT54091.1 alpha/beta hydrolase family protein [Saccharothrix australiensis]